jgi:hypothetical protein
MYAGRRQKANLDLSILYFVLCFIDPVAVGGDQSTKHQAPSSKPRRSENQNTSCPEITMVELIPSPDKVMQILQRHRSFS